MTGNDAPAITQGQKLSSLLALANSSAPALYGLAKRRDGAGGAGPVGSAEEVPDLEPCCRRLGERIGEEKESR